MANKKIGSIWIKIILICIGVLLLGIFVINPILKSILVSQIESKLVGNFYYEYEDLQVDLFSGSVGFENVKWKFPKDTTVFEQGGSVGVFRISGISLLSLIGDTDIDVEGILFENPEMFFRIDKTESDTTESNTGNFNFYDLIEGSLNSLAVETIEVENGSATWVSPEDKKVWRKINRVQFQLNSLELDSAIAAENGGWFKMKNATLDCAGGELFLADSLHKIKSGRIGLDYGNKSLRIDSLQVIPLHSKEGFKDVYPYEIDRMEMLIGEIEIENFEFDTLMRSGKIRINTIKIDEFDLTAFRDKNRPFPPNHFPPLPHLALKDLDVNIKIDTLNLRNSKVKYEQLSEKTQLTGAVFFSEMNADIYNITNDSISYNTDSVATMTVSTKLMDKGVMNVDFGFNLKAENGDHWFAGTLTDFDLPELNGIFKPLLSVSISDGRVDKMNFDVRLNNDVSDGKMTFLYSNLKLKMLDKKSLQGEGLDQKFLSLLANTLLIKKDNPSGNRDPRIGIVHFERIKRKSIFNFWWKSMFTGMQSTVITVSENN